MRCKICNSIINTPVWNGQLNDWEVCSTCLDIINNVFEDPVDNSSYEEEEPEDDLENILLDNIE